LSYRRMPVSSRRNQPENLDSGFRRNDGIHFIN
jgi:hypothetical protein